MQNNNKPVTCEECETQTGLKRFKEEKETRLLCFQHYNAATKRYVRKTRSD